MQVGNEKIVILDEHLVLASIIACQSSTLRRYSIVYSDHLLLLCHASVNLVYNSKQRRDAEGKL